MLEIQKTIVNKRGERLIFDDITLFESFYFTKKDDMVGLLDEDGIEILEPSYDKIIMTQYGCFIVEKDNLYGLVNVIGEWLLQIKYTSISTLCSEDMIKIYLGEKVGFFNLFTHHVIEPSYDDATDFFRGMSKVESEAKYGFINKLGEEFIPVKYDYISEFYEDVAKCAINNKFGFIRIDGFEILTTEYDEITGFNAGYGFAKQGKSYICVDKSGKIIFILNVSLGLQLCNEKYQKLSVDHCEEYIKFDCGLNIIKSEGFYRCQSDDGYSVLQYFYE